MPTLRGPPGGAGGGPRRFGDPARIDAVGPARDKKTALVVCQPRPRVPELVPVVAGVGSVDDSSPSSTLGMRGSAASSSRVGLVAEPAFAGTGLRASLPPLEVADRSFGLIVDGLQVFPGRSSAYPRRWACRPHLPREPRRGEGPERNSRLDARILRRAGVPEVDGRLKRSACQRASHGSTSYACLPRRSGVRSRTPRRRWTGDARDRALEHRVRVVLGDELHRVLCDARGLEVPAPDTSPQLSASYRPRVDLQQRGQPSP